MSKVTETRPRRAFGATLASFTGCAHVRIADPAGVVLGSGQGRAQRQTQQRRSPHGNLSAIASTILVQNAVQAIKSAPTQRTVTARDAREEF